MNSPTPMDSPILFALVALVGVAGAVLVGIGTADYLDGKPVRPSTVLGAFLWLANLAAVGFLSLVP